jgi:cold shock protein
MALQGRVKWFNNAAGWGFIVRDGEPDVFVRHDQIVGDGFKVLQEGDRVEFEERQGKRGPYAVGVVRIGAADQKRAS